ncbi:MAG: corrinoid protein [Anaerolineales bacterium]|jgi:5-methyltetrahydrofolate--homocysteine methyltransferase
MTEISEPLYSDLREALRQGLEEETRTATRQALETGADPLELLQNVLVPTLTEVGRQFQAFEVFLPELMAAGDAAKVATQILEAAIVASGRKSASSGTIVLGTVQSDIHDIGKNILGTLLSSHGFKVVDLGRDVAPSKFLEAAETEKADIVALSALMTTTRPATRNTINLFSEIGARSKYKIIVGGGCIDSSWAKEIGADGYAPDAAAAVDLCKSLLEKKAEK